MSLLFLGAKDHRIKAAHLESLKNEFARLNPKTSQDVLSFYRFRKHSMASQSEQGRLPQLHAN
jgi:hypothetical protein